MDKCFQLHVTYVCHRTLHMQHVDLGFLNRAPRCQQKQLIAVDHLCLNTLSYFSNLLNNFMLAAIIITSLCMVC